MRGDTPHYLIFFLLFIILILEVAFCNVHHCIVEFDNLISFVGLLCFDLLCSETKKKSLICSLCPGEKNEEFNICVNF